MRPAFDFHTLSLTIDNTLEEYRKATGLDQGLNLLGLNIGEVIAGDRSKFLVFRHEHAHFTSFTSSGLADAYSVFADYLVVMLFQVLRRACLGGTALSLPLIPAGREAEVDDPALAVAYRAWQQVNIQRACLFGFGVRTPRESVVDWVPQEEFWQVYGDERYGLIIDRYVDLIRRLGASGEVGALPIVAVGGGRERQLSPAAVMEAYALTIEIVATHIRKMETELTSYGRPTVRNPGALYTVAIEHSLHELLPSDERSGLAEFLDGRAPVHLYYLLPLIAYSAMQTPVMVLPSGNVAIFGDLRTLSIAHRFAAIVDALKQGALELPPPDLRNAGDEALLEWLRRCHDHLGDEWSLTMARDSYVAWERESAKGAVPTGAKLYELTWAARANFYNEPSDYVLDAGLFGERFPAQPAFVRTNDGNLVTSGERDTARYIADHGALILEAAVFGRQWDSAWAKMPEVREEQRLTFIEAAIVFYTWAFNFMPPGDEPEMPAISLAL